MTSDHVRYVGGMALMLTLVISAAALAQDTTTATVTKDCDKNPAIWKAPEQGVPPTCRAPLQLLEVKQDDGHVVKLPYAINKEGDAVFQGDIVIGRAFELVQQTQPATLQAIGDAQLFSLFDKFDAHKWPKGIMYYSIPKTLPPKTKDRIAAAMLHWMSKTKVKFVKATPGTPDYVVFANPSDKDVCNSQVGKVGGVQTINLGLNCDGGNAIHEIGHAFGLTHEQMRQDRDDWVIYKPEHLDDPKYASNFEIHPELYKEVHDYCYASIMHYPRDAFGIDVLEPKKDPNAIIGQRNGLADCDVQAINDEYKGQFAAQ